MAEAASLTPLERWNKIFNDDILASLPVDGWKMLATCLGEKNLVAGQGYLGDVVLEDPAYWKRVCTLMTSNPQLQSTIVEVRSG